MIFEIDWEVLQGIRLEETLQVGKPTDLILQRAWEGEFGGTRSWGEGPHQ